MFLDDLPKALKGKSGNMLTIVFHALLPPHFWQWDDESEVYIKFSHSTLGNWNHDCGPMEFIRYKIKCFDLYLYICISRNIANELIELKLVLKINPGKISNDSIQYKYCVYTGMTKRVENAHLEYLHCDIFPESAIRVLKIGNCQGKSFNVTKLIT